MWRQKVHIGCKAGGQCKGLGSTFGGEGWWFRGQRQGKALAHLPLTRTQDQAPRA